MNNILNTPANKATYAILAGAAITIAQQFLPGYDAELWSAAQTLVVALLVYLIPNKGA